MIKTQQPTVKRQWNPAGIILYRPIRTSPNVDTKGWIWMQLAISSQLQMFPFFVKFYGNILCQQDFFATSPHTKGRFPRIISQHILPMLKDDFTLSIERSIPQFKNQSKTAWINKALTTRVHIAKRKLGRIGRDAQGAVPVPQCSGPVALMYLATLLSAQPVWGAGRGVRSLKGQKGWSLSNSLDCQFKPNCVCEKQP